MLKGRCKLPRPRTVAGADRYVRHEAIEGSSEDLRLVHAVIKVASLST
jgi:hypothetical protein